MSVSSSFFLFLLSIFFVIPSFLPIYFLLPYGSMLVVSSVRGVVLSVAVVCRGSVNVQVRRGGIPNGKATHCDTLY